MGDKICVDAWVRCPHGDYTYEPVYRGSNPITALWRAARAKRTSGCVRIEWRG